MSGSSLTRQRSRTGREARYPKVLEVPFLHTPSEPIISEACSLQGVLDKFVIGKREDISYCFLDERQIIENVRVFQNHFSPEVDRRKIIYAMKANPHPRIMELMLKAGIDGFDCASGEELRAAYALTHNANKLFFNNPTKTIGDIQFSNALNVSYYTVQSVDGLLKLLETKRNFAGVDIAIRINTSTVAESKDVKDRETIDLTTKFGCSLEEAKEIKGLIDLARANVGLAIHPGSQNTDLFSIIGCIRYMAEFADELGGVNHVNIGGGLPVNYLPTHHFDIKHFLEDISGVIDLVRVKLFAGKPGKVIIEPGRSLVANAVTLVVPILEKRPGRITINDGIYTSFIDSVVHGWGSYRFEAISWNGRSFDGGETAYIPPISVILDGRTCDSGDTLGKVQVPANIQRGDLLLFRNAGAYMDSLHNGFNGFPEHQYVLYNRA